MKHTACIIRIVTQCLEIEIEAETADEAFDKAHEMAGGLDFSGREKSAEYDVEIEVDCS